MASSTAGYPGAFRARFRANAFGWKSQPAITRVREAVSEIKKIAKKEPRVAADGAVIASSSTRPRRRLPTSTASSGAIGSAVNRAIEELVAIVAAAPADVKTREGWLQRLSEARAADEIPYIELLADFWGELCVTKETASRWANREIGITRHALSPDPKMRGPLPRDDQRALAALYRAERYDELVELLEPEKFWSYKRWAVKALAAMGEKADAIRLGGVVARPLDERRGRCAALRGDPSFVGTRRRGVRALRRRRKPCGHVPCDVPRSVEEVPDEVPRGSARAARRIDARR